MASPLTPPEGFVIRINEQRDGPPLTALDPLMMLLWHQATAPPERNQMILISGC